MSEDVVGASEVGARTHAIGNDRGTVGAVGDNLARRGV